MKNLLYRTSSQAFGPLFQQAVETQVSKLPFTSREEYLVWVAQWRKDYRLLSKLRRIDKLQSRASLCVLPQKIERLNAQAGALLTPEEAKQGSERVGVIQQEFAKREGYNLYSLKDVILYMLVVRKASKLQAGQQWAAQHAVKT